MTTQDLINTIKQTSSPISTKLVSRIVSELEALLSEVQMRREISCEYQELALDYQKLLATRKEQLLMQERAIMGVREVCALPAAPLEELPSLIENLLSELADRQICADIEPDEFNVAAYAKAEARSQHVARELSFPFQTPPPFDGPEDDEWDPRDTVVPRHNA